MIFSANSIKSGSMLALFVFAITAWAQGSSSSYEFEETDESSREGEYSPLSPSRGAMSPASGVSRTDLSGVSSDLQAYASDGPIDEAVYLVGPGDLFQIFVESSGLEKRVTPEGNIVLNRIGTVQLEGLTLKEAKKRILDKLQTAYKRSNCFVGLSQPKVVRISVTGAVMFPGIYELPGTYRLTDAIRKAGGYSPQAQKGVVEIHTKGGVERINTKDFLLSGRIEANPYICQSCVLTAPFVDFSKPWVTVRRDSVSLFVQLDPGESAYDVIMKAYAFRTSVAFSSVAIREKDGTEFLLAPAGIASYKPKPEAVIEVATERHEVFVGGAVLLPGFQKYRPGRKVAEYISNAGLVHSSRVSKRIAVIRKNGARESVSLQSSDLMPGDVLLVKQNTEQKFLIYTPILLSMVSLALVYVQVNSL
jgi:protein involved in polysaccharide export with SLBB domain